MTGPRALARMAGGLYVVNIVLGAFAIGIVPGMLFVSGDPAATAHNIQANELLYRSSLAAHVIVTATNVPLAVIFYELFKVVNRRIASLVVFFIIVGTSVEAAGLLNQFAPLTLLNGNYLHGLNADQLQALAYAPVTLSSVGYDINEVFFGFNALALGYLVYRSTFLPRLIGVLLVIDGVGYLVYSFADILAPGFASHLVPWIQLPVLAAEGSLALWFLIAGVNVQRWSELQTHERSGMPGVSATL